MAIRIMASEIADKFAMHQLRDALEKIVAVAENQPSAATARRIRDELKNFAGDVERARERTDKVYLPVGSFDPHEPKSVGRMVALAMLAQARVPLGGIPDTYGSGVYAIYYQGNHPLYAEIRGKETPIYVGKADPEKPDANTSREQGKKLTGRLHEHAETILAVERYAATNVLPVGLHDIRLDDFTCRRLVCATNAQLVAEVHLIEMFQPLWNSKTKACWGVSKHGDAAATRKNKRSPWDVVHPGRIWALDGLLVDALSPDEIGGKINEVLKKTPPRTSHADLLEEILMAFRQDRPEPEQPFVSPLGAEASGPEQDEAGVNDD